MKGWIVCVDDKREVLAALLRDLGEFGGDFELIDCESADEAFDVLGEAHRSGEVVRLVITDHEMPGTDGRELVRTLDENDDYRDLPKVVLTPQGPSDAQAGRRSTARADEVVLSKPWDGDSLRSTVRSLLTW